MEEMEEPREEGEAAVVVESRWSVSVGMSIFCSVALAGEPPHRSLASRRRPRKTCQHNQIIPVPFFSKPPHSLLNPIPNINRQMPTPNPLPPARAPRLPRLRLFNPLQIPLLLRQRPLRIPMRLMSLPARLAQLLGLSNEEALAEVLGAELAEEGEACGSKEGFLADGRTVGDVCYGDKAACS